MKIGVKGKQKQVSELGELLSTDHTLVPLKSTELESYDLIFDLDFDDDPSLLKTYSGLKGKPVFAGSAKIQLEQSCADAGISPECLLIGMNTLPTFINRSILECCTLNDKDKQAAENLLADLGLKATFTESRLGFVSPRIVCMIINEAYYTVQEGTASREDIDLGMKLGTAYPRGPFEWSRLIGIDQVYLTLHALYEDTKDERYKICPLLKTEYLQSLV